MPSTALLALLLLALSCSAAPVAPACAPGTIEKITADCAVEMAADLATQSECDARIDSWQKGCLR